MTLMVTPSEELATTMLTMTLSEELATSMMLRPRSECEHSLWSQGHADDAVGGTRDADDAEALRSW